MPNDEDFDISGVATRLDNIEQFKKEYDGKNFDKKVLDSINESVLIQDKIKGIAWLSIRQKIVWIILGGVSIIFLDLVLRVIPRFFESS